MNKSVFTRQGVRDLSFLPGKSKGRKVTLPETIGDPVNCPHPNMMTNRHSGTQSCPDCGRSWGDDGEEFLD